MSDSKQAVLPMKEEGWLLATARNIASALKLRASGTPLRIRVGITRNDVDQPFDRFQTDPK